MKITDNREKLVIQSVVGKIHHPTISRSGEVKTGHDGASFVLPSVGGITYNVAIGDCVYDKFCDHVEPGVTIRNPDDRENGALVSLACVGNTATVVSGDAKGAKGIVTGFHGGIDHTICWFSNEDMEKMLPEDKIAVRAYGQGLSVNEIPEIKLTGIDPELFEKMGLSIDGGCLSVPVTAIVPSHLIGAGQGCGSAYNGDCDLMTADWEEIKKYKLDALRYGDIVFMENTDHSYGRGFLSGAVTVGVVVHSDCVIAGHGPGITTIMTCKTSLIKPVMDSEANIGKYLNIGRWSK